MSANFPDFGHLAATVRQATRDGSLDPVAHEPVVAALLAVYRAAESGDTDLVRSRGIELSEVLLQAGFAEAGAPAATRDWHPDRLEERSDAEVCNSVLVMSGIVLDEIKRAYADTNPPA